MELQEVQVLLLEQVTQGVGQVVQLEESGKVPAGQIEVQVFLKRNRVGLQVVQFEMSPEQV